jgi:hypothetical protein
MQPFFILITAFILLQPLNAQSLYFPPATGSTWHTISPKTQSSSKEISIPISKMQKGIYIVRAKMTNGREWTVKFVKH